VWHEPILPRADAPDRDAEIRRITLEWTRALEEEIRARPDHWAWFHRRWRTTPESLRRSRERRAEKEARRTRRRAQAQAEAQAEARKP
jgi:lauroyl/myristoyl acyltransferase